MRLRYITFITVALGLVAAVPRPAPARAPGMVESPERLPDGKEIYLSHCKECHGVLGAPTKASLRKYDKIPNFRDPDFFKSRTDAELLKAVTEGKGRDMKGFSEKLSKDEIEAVVAYLRTLEKKD